MWITCYNKKCKIQGGQKMTNEEYLERANYDKELLNEFMKLNDSVEVIDVEHGDLDDTSVPAAQGRWLKVTTRNHGWLHVYYNKNSGEVEWF